MKKINTLFILTSLLFIVALSNCKKDDKLTPLPERFQVLDAKSAVKGSLVEGLALTNANTFSVAFANAPANTSAIISAETVNGISMDENTVSFSGTGAVEIPLKGKPLTDGTFIITVKIKIDDVTYICSKEFYVDMPNVTAIKFDIVENTVFNTNVATDLVFEIYPKTTVLDIVAPANATVEVISNSATSRTLRVTPNGQFISGDVKITASFMSIPAVIKTVKFTAFAKGDGTTAAPYEIPDGERLNRIAYGLANAYQLTANITQANPSTSTSVFSGTLDGDGKKISAAIINKATTDKVGFFAEIAASGVVKNVTFENLNVTGKDLTGGVAGLNRGTISGVTLTGNVIGALNVGGVTGSNFGTITNCDISNINVSGTNNIGSLAGLINSGSTQTSNVVLIIPTTFPTNVYGISSTKVSDFIFTPTDGTIVVKSVTTNLTASVVAGQQKVMLTPTSAFISGDLQLSLQKNKLSALRTVKIFSKLEGSLFDGGDGSVGNPFLISTADALDYVRNDPSKSYKITANITLSGTWTPISSFSGVIDGQGHNVNNLTINSTSANEGWVNTNSGTIKNIRFLNVNCTTSAAFGVIAGRNTGTIQNVLVGGTLTSTNSGDVLGGIAGELSSGGKITQCYTKLTTTASCGMVGGIVGRLTTATGSVAEISLCTATGTIEINASKNRIGGILGRAEGNVTGGGIIKNCLSSLVITSTGASAGNVNGVGGIFGADQSAGIVPIDQCKFDGKINCGFSIGGIAGVGSTITNCLVVGEGPSLSVPTLRSTGTAATGNVGGIAGTNKVKLLNCVVKNATLKAAATTAAMAVGGLVSTYQNGGYSANSFVGNTSLEGSTAAPNNEFIFRITGTAANSPGVNASNYVGTGVTTLLRTTAIDNDAGGLDGATTSNTSQTFFQSTLGFDFSTIWKIDTDGYPSLKSAGYNGGLTAP